MVPRALRGRVTAEQERRWREVMPGKRKKSGHGARSKARIGVKKKRRGEPRRKVTLNDLHECITSVHLGDEWYDNTPDCLEQIRLSRQEFTASEPVVVTRCLIVSSDLTWTVYIHGHRVEQEQCPVLQEFQSLLNVESFKRLVTLLDTLHVCPGNPDQKFVEMCENKKGKLLTTKGETAAYLDTKCSVTYAGSTYSKTVRHVGCELLVTGTRCQECLSYRNNLRSMYANFSKKKTPSKAGNLRYMDSPQKIRHLKLVRQALRNKQRQLQRLQQKLCSLTAEHGVIADASLQNDLENVLHHAQQDIEKLPRDNFKRIFWEQQIATSKAKSSKGIRWHPLFIRWCLNIMLSSPRTYNVIRDSGFVSLPSKRTLRDHTNWMKMKPGFQSEVMSALIEQAKVDDLPEWKRHMVLAFDEMKIREDLVFTGDGDIIGFVDTGDMDNNLWNLERSCLEEQQEEPADHMLALMVRGIFIKLDYEFAQFPTRNLTGLQLHDIVWGAVRRLQEIALQVDCIVCDGGKPNRKFIHDHISEEGVRDGVVYKVRNMYDPTKFIYFMTDVPHLMKTTRNCWANSHSQGSRYLTINGRHILWHHLHKLHEKCSTQSGLYIGNRLTHEHLHLNSYSRMNVRLAVQVLSKSVVDAFAVCRELDSTPSSLLNDTMETEKFCRIFDKFFDCMNTRCLQEAGQKRKPDLQPYRSPDDSRLKWLQNDFIGYLKEWEASVKSRKDVSAAAKNTMMLSKETRDGLRMTVYSFTELVPCLLSMSGPKFLLSERFNQDPLEIYFGKQRARGGRSDNPSAKQFLDNVQAIRVGKSLAFGHCSNIQKRKLEHNVAELSQPLPKRRALLP